MENCVSTKAARDSQVNACLSKLDKEVGMLSEVIERLDHRLQTALRTVSPSPESQNEKVAERLVPLAEGMESFIQRLRDHRNRIESIIDRCEL